MGAARRGLDDRELPRLRRVGDVVEREALRAFWRQSCTLVTARSPRNEDVATLRTIVFSVQVPARSGCEAPSAKVETSRGRRTFARL